MVDYITGMFQYTYILLIVMCIITSFAVPVDRGIGIFRFLMFFFGVVMSLTMLAVIYFLIKGGIV